MTKDQLEEARELRARGWTYKEIANEYGVSRQYICYLLTDSVNKNRGTQFAGYCIFPALRRALLERHAKAIDLHHIIYGVKPDSKRGYYSAKLRNKVAGVSQFAYWEWVRMSKAFGIPLEELMDDNGAHDAKEKEMEEFENV